MTTSQFEIVNEPIQIEQVQQKVAHRNAGAITLFVGTVREMTNGKKTIHLEYEAYKPMAIIIFQKIAEEIIAKWPNTKLAITHRIGTLQISDIAVVVAVSSPHRKAAFEANEYAMERIKQIVPIWKKEIWEDGTAWIGDQLQNIPYPNGAPALKEEQT